jgi:hypothetical protein
MMRLPEGFNDRIGQRISIQAKSGTLQVKIRASRNPWGLFFLPFWLAVWGVATVSMWANVLTGRVELVLVAIPFTAIWLATSALWCWWLTGSEWVWVDRDKVLVGRRVLALVSQRSFRKDAVRDLRALPAFEESIFYGSPWTMSGSPLTGKHWSDFRKWLSWSFGLGPGNVGFNVGKEVVRFGVHLQEHEARDLSDLIRAALPTS